MLAALGLSVLTLGAAHADTSSPSAPTSVPPAPDPGIAGLPADATLEQLQQAIIPMFGPTTDVMAEFGIFGITPPAGVPTPAGATIDSFDFDLNDLERGEDAFYWAKVVFGSDVPAAEMVTLYQTELSAAGYTQTGDSVRETDRGRQIRTLTYDMPGSTHFMAEFQVHIVADDSGDFVQLEFRDAVDPALGAAFTSWTDLPFIDQATVREASIGNFILGSRVAIETEYLFPIGTPAPDQLEQQFLASLEGTPYTVDADRSQPGSWAELERAEFDGVTAYFHDWEGGTMSRLIIDAQYDIESVPQPTAPQPTAAPAAPEAPTTAPAAPEPTDAPAAPAAPTTGPETAPAAPTDAPAAPEPTDAPAAPEPTDAPAAPEPTDAPAAPAAPTTAPETAPAAPTAPDAAPTTAVGPPASPEPGPAPGPSAGLPADAAFQQLHDAIIPMFGPTPDVMAAFETRFGITAPAGVPTPAGASIFSFDFHLEDLDDAENAYYRAVVVFESDVPAAELVTLYQTELPAAGYIQTGDSVRNTDSGRQIRWLDYDLPDPTYRFAEISVGIVADDEGDFVQIEFREAVDPALGAAFTSWTGIPFVDEATMVRSAQIGNFLRFGRRASVDTEYWFPIATPEELEAQFVASLEGTPYTVDPDRGSEGIVYLQGGEFESVTVFFHSSWEDGMSRLIFDATFELNL